MKLKLKFLICFLCKKNIKKLKKMDLEVFTKEIEMTAKYSEKLVKQWEKIAEFINSLNEVFIN